MILQDKKALVLGVANEKSIAYSIAKEFKAQGARIALSYPNEILESRVLKASENLGGEYTFQLDVQKDEDLESAKYIVAKHWGDVDILVHSIAYAPREDLLGRFIDTSREGFQTALDVSAYSLIAICHAFKDLFVQGSSVMTMTYLGSERVVQNYNVMGVAKAALEACMRYLAADLGRQGIRVNAISAGPIKTLAAAGIPGLRELLRLISFKSPLGRNVTQEEVAKTALFLASKMSAGTTGEVIFVDSGYNILGI